jgi:hypothetical protein
MEDDNDSNYAITINDSSLWDETDYMADYGSYSATPTWTLSTSADDRLDVIEQVLGIPKRDIELEALHPELRELYEAQIEKVKQTLASVDYSEYTEACDKKRAWDILNK